MAAKTMPSGGLSAASNPSARLQELLRRDSAIPEQNTEKNTEGHTETHTENLATYGPEIHTSFQPEHIAQMKAEAIAENNPEVMTEAFQASRPQKRKPGKAEKLPAPPPSSSVSMPSSSASVRQRIVEDLQKEPVVRKTIDIPASLNERLQDYCAAKRIKTERRVFLVLLENFLEEEGF